MEVVDGCRTYGGADRDVELSHWDAYGIVELQNDDVGSLPVATVVASHGEGGV